MKWQYLLYSEYRYSILSVPAYRHRARGHCPLASCRIAVIRCCGQSRIDPGAADGL